jgi:hypothetical protein
MTRDIGDQVRLGATFTNLSGAPSDPTNISLTVTTPGHATVTYTYAGAELTKTGTGVYYKDLDLTSHGVWKFRWMGTGAIVAAEPGTLFVRRRRI